MITVLSTLVILLLLGLGYGLNVSALFWTAYTLLVLLLLGLLSIAFFDRRHASRHSISAFTNTNQIPITNTQNDPSDDICKLANLSHGRTFIEQFRLQLPPDNSPDGPNLHIVLVHGFSSHEAMTQQLSTSLKQIITDNNLVINQLPVISIISYHLYGRGYSDCPSSPHSEALFNTQLSEVLLHCEGISSGSKFILMGFSMGGAIAVSWTNKFSDRVYKLVSIAPAGLPVHKPITAYIATLPFLGDIATYILAKSELLGELESEYYNEFKDDNNDQKKEMEKSIEKWKGIYDIWFNGQKWYWWAIISTLRYFPDSGMTSTFDKMYGKEVIRNKDWLFVLGKNDGNIPGSNFDKFEKCKKIILDECGHMDLVAPYGVQKWIEQFWEWANEE